jgi:hypothetical protein
MDANLQSTGYCSQPPPRHNRIFSESFPVHNSPSNHPTVYNKPECGKRRENGSKRKAEVNVNSRLGTSLSEGMKNVAKKPEEKGDLEGQKLREKHGL